MKVTRNRGFTLIELLVVIAILALLITLLLPAIQSVYAAARRLQCQAKEKEIALATNAYHDAYKRFPPSNHTKKSGTNELRDGYSFLVDLLPYMAQEALWKRMDVTEQLTETERAASASEQANYPLEVLRQAMPMYRCPASATTPYVDETATPADLQAITNYKAVCASTKKAYQLSAGKSTTKTIYDTKKESNSADGVIYPGSRTSQSSVSDGVTNTFLLTESEEQKYARWIVGQECGVYTMVDGQTFNDPTTGSGTNAISYVHPTGFEAGKFGPDSTVKNKMQNLNRDYTATPEYKWTDLISATSKITFKNNTSSSEQTQYGPSGKHAGGVVNHAYAGGAVVAVNKDVDVAVYFFLTTRANGDPAVEPD